MKQEIQYFDALYMRTSPLVAHVLFALHIDHTVSMSDMSHYSILVYYKKEKKKSTFFAIFSSKLK